MEHDIKEARPRRTGTQVRMRVAEDLGLPKGVVREVIEAYIAGIAQGIAEGEEVCVEGLGIFQARKVVYKKGVTLVWCPRGKGRRELVKSGARVSISFRRSPRLGRFLKDRWLTDKERGRMNTSPTELR